MYLPILVHGHTHQVHFVSFSLSGRISIPGYITVYRFVDSEFCRACALFAPNQVGRRDLGQFVTVPIRSWMKVTQLAHKHASREYHENAMAKMEEFVARYENPPHTIDTLLDK